MVEDDLEIRTSAGTSDSVIVAPGRDGQWPGVIMLTDIAGIRPAFREMARRLAGAGYTVLMPNLFYRTARAPIFETMPDWNDERTRSRVAALRTPLTPEAIERDGSAYVDFLAAHANVSPGPLGVVGYCAAGSFAMRFAAARPDAIAAAASFHGGGLVVANAPNSPHTQAAKTKAQFLIAIAANDDQQRPMEKDVLKQTFADAKLPAEIEVYTGAAHGWCPPDSGVYNEPQAEKAWARLIALYGKALA